MTTPNNLSIKEIADAQTSFIASVPPLLRGFVANRDDWFRESTLAADKRMEDYHDAVCTVLLLASPEFSPELPALVVPVATAVLTGKHPTLQSALDALQQHLKSYQEFVVIAEQQWQQWNSKSEVPESGQEN